MGTEFDNNDKFEDLEISNMVCVKIRKSKKRWENERDKKYYRMGEQLEINLNEFSRMSFTVFVKGGKPEQIQRNSKRKSE